ncbi:TPA: DEAD/DEAH box helicase [Campylobacter coli]|nr:DEAD/DEAH box helicase [Campylobacter coli]HEF1256680.1 DEAD/DEAH box helicase [Campylobacter coli]HEH4747515.1 DEAD/DEAH box helicase [Campylobacter coli]
MDRLTLRKLYNTEFPKLYAKFLKNEKLSNSELEKILSIGIFLVGLEDTKLQKLGYRLFLIYSKSTNDYKPLYEVSLNKGLIPISQFIENNLEYSKNYSNLHTIINNITSNKFKWNKSYQTIGQYELFKKSIDLKLESQIVVAPTSYGKTELILSFIDYSNFNKICIISPTKSLLTQTKKRILNKFGCKKIITYPEMYNSNDDKIIAVLTQERLLRLLQNNPNLKFDLLIVDEAHNLLDEFSEENYRSVILASVIIICTKRNNNIVCKYLTPFLVNKDSVDIKHISNDINWCKVEENIKSELFYFYDLSNGKKLLLDQYSPLKEKFIELDANHLREDSEVIIKYCDNKNIIYLNSPKKLEEFAKELYEKLPTKQSSILSKAAKDLKEYIHDEYELAHFIQKGVIYHHGSMPEQVRYYIENLYTDAPEVNMLIANSTLLEGVNIPATKMFILDPSRGNGYLSASSFRNLIGRVCRFGEIFNENIGNLNYLMPEIHIVKGRYCRTNFNASSFVKEQKILVENSDKITDEVNNPLLKTNNANPEKVKKAEEILRNISSVDSIVEEYNNKPETKVGKLCFENNVNIFNIFEVEEQISKELKQLDKIRNLDMIFKAMNFLFFSKIDENSGVYNNLKRLKEMEAQKFYKMLINWRITGFTTKEMINKMVDYWNTLRNESKIVYVGKWGDKTRGGYKKYWTDISQKNTHEKINLAIVRLKEEYDFIDNEIVKYIEILHSVDLIEESFYLKIKYGTDNKEKIALLNCGISNILVKLLKDKYENMYQFDFASSTVFFSEELVSKMIENQENGILISEVKMNSKE